MSQGIVRRAAAGWAVLVVVLAGCGRSLPSHPTPPVSPRATESDTAAQDPGSAAGPESTPGAGGTASQAGKSRARPGGRSGHPYFPLTVGLYSDFRQNHIDGSGVRYLRVTVREPELFFGRMAYPWTYGPIPGMVPDSSLVGLRQYFSIGEDGALLFHGAQNNGFMSHLDPPVRQLLADPRPGQAWTDTSFFESFFPGGIPFFAATEVFDWWLSERTQLRLPIGPVQAMRASFRLDIIDAPEPLEKMAGARGLALLTPVGLKDTDILKGFWFARRRGVVARDYPLGQGTENLNHTSLELVRQGFEHDTP